MTQVIATDRPELAPFSMPERFRREIVYFMTPGDSPSAPTLKGGEYWIDPKNVADWLDCGVFTLVSPLDAESVAEIELSEEQELWLEWMLEHQISVVRLA